MRSARILSTLVAFALAGIAACRTASPAPAEDAPRPAPPIAEASSASEARAEPAPAPAAVHAEHAAAAPVAARVEAPPNRDKHGNADVAAYLDVLQSEKRVADLQIDVVLAKLALPTDAVIGDLGCGPGVFTIPFARACPEGIVFAADIEPRQLDVVRAKMRAVDVHNVVPVLSSEDDAHFPPALLDIVFLADTYHHLEDRVEYLHRLSKALKPGGRLVILDYKSGKLDIGPPPEHKLPAGVMDKELVAAGWKLVERFDTHPSHDFEVWRLVQPWEKK